MAAQPASCTASVTARGGNRTKKKVASWARTRASPRLPRADGSARSDIISRCGEREEVCGRRRVRAASHADSEPLPAPSPPPRSLPPTCSSSRSGSLKLRKPSTAPATRPGGGGGASLDGAPSSPVARGRRAGREGPAACGRACAGRSRGRVSRMRRGGVRALGEGRRRVAHSHAPPSLALALKCGRARRGRVLPCWGGEGATRKWGHGEDGRPPPLASRLVHASAGHPARILTRSSGADSLRPT